MDKNKVKSIIEWPTPKSMKVLQIFLGVCNYNKKFIMNFAKIMKPLRILLKKNSEFNWNKDAENAFKKLILTFTTDEIPIYPDPDKELTVKTDASDFAVGCILSQISDMNSIMSLLILDFVIFWSKLYYIYDEELLNIITAFETWRHHLEGA